MKNANSMTVTDIELVVERLMGVGVGFVRW